MSFETIFQTPEWKSILLDTFPNFESAGPYFIRIKSWLFGNRVVSLPFTPFVDPPDHSYICYRRDRYVEIRSSKELKWLGKKQLDQTYSTFIMPLISEEDNWKLMSKYRRKAIRRAQDREGIKVKEGTMEQFYQLYLENKIYLGSPPYPYRMFELIKERIKHKIFIALDGSKIVTALLLFLYADTIIIMHGMQTKDPVAMQKHAHEYCYWEAIKWAIQQGYKKWDWGRSPRNSLTCDFKKRWGAEEKPLYYYFLFPKGHGKIPSFNPASKKWLFYQKLWSKLPLSWSKTLGPIIVKHLE